MDDGPVSGEASDVSLYCEDAPAEMRECVHVYGGRSSWPGRVAHHEFGFDAGEAPVDGAEALGRGAAFVADEGLVRLHLPVDSVER